MKRNLFYAVVFFILALSSVQCTGKLYHSKIKGYYKLEKNVSRDINISSDSSIIIGKIIDNKTKLPVPYGWVKVYGIPIGMSADSLGNYLLKVPSGRYELSVGSGSNTEVRTKKIKFEKNQILHIDFYLGSYWIH